MANSKYGNIPNKKGSLINCQLRDYKACICVYEKNILACIELA